MLLLSIYTVCQKVIGHLREPFVVLALSKLGGATATFSQLRCGECPLKYSTIPLAKWKLDAFLETSLDGPNRRNGVLYDSSRGPGQVNANIEHCPLRTTAQQQQRGTWH